VTLIAVFSTASWAAPLQTFDGQLDVGPVLQAGSIRALKGQTELPLRLSDGRSI
jgi:hypothetical protein